jgi:predicted TIM-barrel fold metal-dependent hydrolase
VAAIKRSIHVSPFWEEDLAALAELVGVERVLFGSDFPHPEGLAQPARYVEEIKDMPLDAQKLIMGGNLARLMSA